MAADQRSALGTAHPFVIVGGGAAGLMAAIVAASRLGPGRVLVLEAARETGRKILISGGGRCNVLPMRNAPERFVSSSPNRLVRRFLERFPLREQRAFFEELLGAPLREEPESQKLFPESNRARDVRDALRSRAEELGAGIRASSPVRDLVRCGNAWRLMIDAGAIDASAILVATGGRSVLGQGADALGLDWVSALGHTIRAPYAALAPLTAPGAPHGSLSGLSLDARVSARCGDERAESSGGFLFTHKGYSGPSVLNVSHVVERAAGAGVRVTARFTPFEKEDVDWDAALRSAPGNLAPLLRKRFPDRLAGAVIAAANVQDVSLSRLTREARRAVVEMLEAFPLPVNGTEGYRTAEVMGGGVALEEVDPATGESRIEPGLFLAGEILDAFGPIGGFNFQWAWSTGRTAGGGAASFLDAAPWSSPSARALSSPTGSADPPTTSRAGRSGRRACRTPRPRSARRR